MTGNEIIAELQVQLGESQSTAAQQQTMLYPRHVRRAADKAARETDALYRHAVTDIVAGQVEYPVPARPYRLMAVNVKDQFGRIRPQEGITPEVADQRYSNWRAQPNNPIYQGVPAFYLAEGLTSYKLFPVPNYSVQDGLIISGYYGVDKWWDMSMDSPLPEEFDEAIVAGAGRRRCMEMQRIDPAYTALLPQYQATEESLLRDLWRDTMGANAARRGGLIPSRGSRMGGFGGAWGWWGG